MERNNEMTVLEQKDGFLQQQLRELNDLQLALVGGGVGETIL